MDWWGWCDTVDSADKLVNNWEGGDMGPLFNVNRDGDWTTAEGGNASAEQFNATMKNASIEWTCTRMGTTIRNDFKITNLTSGEVYTYWTIGLNAALDKNISLALGAEFGSYQVVSVVKHK
jgi:hypothetical protein